MARVSGNLSLGQVIGDAADRRARELNVSLPGIVVSYDSATETATIQPAVNRLLPSVSDPDEDVSEKLPAIPDVPVAWYRARGVSIVPPEGLSPGDPVTLLCCDRDISAWSRSGALSDPDDARAHSWANAIAIPGLVPSTNPFPAPSDAAALASLVYTQLAALTVQVNALTLAHNTHTHTIFGPSILPPPAGVPAAAATVLAPTTVLVASLVGSQILKVDL